MNNLLKPLQVLPTLAIDHPAATGFMRDVADGQQLFDINQRQGFILIRFDHSQSVIKVIWQTFVHLAIQQLCVDYERLIRRILSSNLKRYVDNFFRMIDKLFKAFFRIAEFSRPGRVLQRLGRHNETVSIAIIGKRELHASTIQEYRISGFYSGDFHD